MDSQSSCTRHSSGKRSGVSTSRIIFGLMSASSCCGLLGRRKEPRFPSCNLLSNGSSEVLEEEEEEVADVVVLGAGVVVITALKVGGGGGVVVGGAVGGAAGRDAPPPVPPPPVAAFSSMHPSKGSPPSGI